jgi:hypothetical protein
MFLFNREDYIFYIKPLYSSKLYKGIGGTLENLIWIVKAIKTRYSVTIKAVFGEGMAYANIWSSLFFATYKSKSFKTILERSFKQ